MPADVASVVSVSGGKVSSSEVSNGYTDSGGARQCLVEWTDASQTQLKANVGADQGAYDSALKAASTPAGVSAEGTVRTLDFGAGVQGFVNGVGAVMDVPCTVWGGNSGSSHLFVSVGTSTASKSPQAQQGFVDSAFEIAKAAVRRVPCTNTVSFVASAPVVR